MHDRHMIEDCVVLRFDTVSVAGWFLVFQRQYATSKRREPISQWHHSISQKNGVVNLIAMKTSRLTHNC